MADFSDFDRAQFAYVVARAWAAEQAGKPLKSADDLLKHLELPKGARKPEIPKHPAGDLGTAWAGLTFDHWDLKIEKLPPDVAGISVSSLACLACPVSCFSSVSN